MAKISRRAAAHRRVTRPGIDVTFFPRDDDDDELLVSMHSFHHRVTGFQLDSPIPSSAAELSSSRVIWSVLTWISRAFWDSTLKFNFFFFFLLIAGVFNLWNSRSKNLKYFTNRFTWWNREKFRVFWKLLNFRGSENLRHFEHFLFFSLQITADERLRNFENSLYFPRAKFWETEAFRIFRGFNFAGEILRQKLTIEDAAENTSTIDEVK